MSTQSKLSTNIVERVSPRMNEEEGGIENLSLLRFYKKNPKEQIFINHKESSRILRLSLDTEYNFLNRIFTLQFVGEIISYSTGYPNGFYYYYSSF